MEDSRERLSDINCHSISLDEHKQNTVSMKTNSEPDEEFRTATGGFNHQTKKRAGLLSAVPPRVVLEKSEFGKMKRKGMKS
jgi:hypothetical protein